MVSNPDSFYLLLTALQGEREMWPRLASIDANCGIEVTLDECTRELRSKLQRSVSTARRGRVPSWAVENRDSCVLLSGGGSSEPACLASKVDAAVEAHREGAGGGEVAMSPRAQIR